MSMMGYCYAKKVGDKGKRGGKEGAGKEETSNGGFHISVFKLVQ